MLLFLIILVLAYLVGSIPTSIIAGKLMKGIDIRKHGSGNAGAANTFRVLGWKAGIIVALIDVMKGFSATYYISRIGADTIPLNYDIVRIFAGTAAVAGHIWTVFAGFKGGKGVLTAAGMFLGLAPFTIITSFAVFGVVFYASRYVSLGSLAAAVTFCGLIFVQKYLFHNNISATLLIFSALMVSLVIYTHRSNIKRLLNGTENKFARKND